MIVSLVIFAPYQNYDGLKPLTELVKPINISLILKYWRTHIQNINRKQITIMPEEVFVLIRAKYDKIEIPDDIAMKIYEILYLVKDDYKSGIDRIFNFDINDYSKDKLKELGIINPFKVNIKQLNQRREMQKQDK